MPIYLINAVGLEARGPFDTKEEVAAAAEEFVIGDGEGIVAEVDDSGAMTVTDSTEYLEAVED